MGKNYHLGWVFKPLRSGLVTSKSAHVWSQAGSSGGWAEAQLPSGLVMTLSSAGKRGMLIILSIAAGSDVEGLKA